jgi:hypothetical protein
MSVNILTASNTGNRKTAVSMRRPVNTSLKNVTTIRGKLCFLCGLRQANARNNMTYIPRQRSCKHASLTKEDSVFRGVRAEELFEDSGRYESVSPRKEISTGIS